MNFMNKIIIANWKMNPLTLKEAERLFIETQNYVKKIGNKAEIIIAPPFIYLESLLQLKTKNLKLKTKLAGQDCCWEQKGAYTGEISPLMLKNLGCEYVIIGHSERRRYYKESDEMIAKKLKAALDVGLKPILCVGETSEERKSGRARQVVEKQIKGALKDIPNPKFLLRRETKFLLRGQIPNSKFIIAYEPVWAIGTGVPCHPKEAVKMHKFIKKILYSKFHILNSKILYGGSVDSKNIKSFLEKPEIDGALVGGASLKAEELIEIFKLAQQYV